MDTNQRRIALALAAAAGALLAAAILPTAVAFADEYDFTPDIATFEPTQVEGYPPLFDEVTGTESWGLNDLTTNTVPVPDSGILGGTDTETTIGSFTNDDFLFQQATVLFLRPGLTFTLPTDTQIDLANFGGGFENEWISIPAGGTDPGVSDLLITPFGDFSLFGSAFSDLSTAIG